MIYKATLKARMGSEKSAGVFQTPSICSFVLTEPMKIASTPCIGLKAHYSWPSSELVKVSGNTAKVGGGTSLHCMPIFQVCREKGGKWWHKALHTLNMFQEYVITHLQQVWGIFCPTGPAPSWGPASSPLNISNSWECFHKNSFLKIKKQSDHVCKDT